MKHTRDYTHRFDRTVNLEQAASDTDVVETIDAIEDTKDAVFPGRRTHVYDYHDLGHLDQSVCYTEDTDDTADRSPASSSLRMQIAQIAAGVVVSYAAAVFVMLPLQGAQLTINGDTATIPPVGPTGWIGLALLFVVIGVVMIAVQVFPDMPSSRGGGRYA